MKKLYAIFAITIMFALTFVANAAPNTNSHKEATGTFFYTVEPPLVITTNTSSQDLGAVCPNCTVNFNYGDKCLQWTVTGGASCNVLVSMSETTPPETGVTINTSMEYSDDTPVAWEASYGEHTDGAGGIFHIGTNNLTFRVCANSLSASNSATAGVNLADVWTIVADYSSDVAPHL